MYNGLLVLLCLFYRLGESFYLIMVMCLRVAKLGFKIVFFGNLIKFIRLWLIFRDVDMLKSKVRFSVFSYNMGYWIR